METKLVKVQQAEDDLAAIKEAAEFIRQGEVAAFPTETVYGLGGNGLLKEAVQKIYKAKGRPSDNPLILHVCDISMAESLTEEIPPAARKAMERFWPGPMTVILKKSKIVPFCVTGGLSTVAVRMPAHETALRLIREAGIPIAAPSANTSGRPSPTKAEHVMEDLNGKIPMILDGGTVKVGVESTIVDFTENPPVILRPGRITKEELEEVTGGTIRMNTSFSEKENGIPKAPGMKYKHYAPKAFMTIVLGERKAVTEKINCLAKEQRQAGKRVGIIGTDETIEDYIADEVVSVGSRDRMETVTANLYDVLRAFDHKDVDIIYTEGFEKEPLSEAVMNRLVKAAGHQIIQI